MWKIERLLQHAVQGATNMVFDGRDVWVGLNNASLKILSYWDSSTDEFNIINNDLFPNIELDDNKGLVEVDTVDISEYATTTNSLVKVYDTIYTYGDCVLIGVHIPSKDVDTVPLPDGANPTSILSANNKVWIVSSDANFKQDTLFFYDTITKTWSDPVGIPGITQSRPRDMVWAHDSYVVVAGFNDNKVHKFNSTTGLHIDSTYINRKPQAITSNDNRQIIIGSYNGMISTYNQQTNFVNHTDGILDEAVGVIDDGTFLWTISPYLSRKRKNQTTDALRFQSKTATHPKYGEFTGTEGYASESFGGDEFSQILITPEFKYTHWNGIDFEERIVKQYIFLLTENAVFALRNASLYRENFTSVRATGMIAVGESGYYGETR